MAEFSELDERLREALTQAIPCALFVLDADERVIFWNAAAEALTGYPAAEMMGASCETLRVRLVGAEGEAVDGACPYQVVGEGWRECEIRRRDGTPLSVVRRTTPVTGDDGGMIGAIQTLVDVSEIKRARGQIEALRHAIARAGRFDRLIGAAPPMVKLYEAIETVAPTDASVVIEGETGTGKELVARTLHSRSRRADGVFLPVNCGALPETLIEAELFGHVRGAFTGASTDRAGRFEEASGGTLLLDEVGELPAGAQVKLLRAIQEGEITRVGESRPRQVHVRIIAATHRDLAEEVRAGRFREDLYYRLRVVSLRVPPLRERREDIPDLVAHFIARLNGKYGRSVEGCEPEAMDLLTSAELPGNVRQLEHALEHAFVVTPPDSGRLPLASFPAELRHPEPARPVAGDAEGESPDPRPAELRAIADERRRVDRALELAGGNKTRAAELLGITRAGLYKKLKRLGVEI